MNGLEILLDKRWILKSEDKELYYKVRDSLGEVRKFAADKLGCQIIENSLLVKMEKIPAVAEEFMGIGEFTSKMEYVLFCILLMFLEEKDAEEQFVLSALTEYVEANIPEGQMDWTLYTNRRRLVKVLRYAVSQGMLKVTDGSDDVFMDERTGEVLYENTGVSRYFMRNFSRDIMEYSKPEDLNESEWYAMDEDRGIIRRHRVYKRLLFSPAMNKEDGSIEDFEYLKNYGRRLSEDLEHNLDCRVQIHKGSAFLLLGENCRPGECFPGNNAISDIILLVCAKIRKNVEEGQWKTNATELIYVDQIAFERMLKDLKIEAGAGFTKYYREMPEGEFVREIMNEMEKWTFIRKRLEEHQVVIYPLSGKITGHYPKDYAGGMADEQQMAGE